MVRIYKENFSKISGKLRDRGVDLLDLDFSEEHRRQSSYVQMMEDSPELVPADEVDCWEQLTTIWNGLPLEMVQELIQPLQELSAKLDDEFQEQDEDVSTDLYVMN
jgi:hypothetical protein